MKAMFSGGAAIKNEIMSIIPDVEAMVKNQAIIPEETWLLVRWSDGKTELIDANQLVADMINQKKARRGDTLYTAAFREICRRKNG